MSLWSLIFTNLRRHRVRTAIGAMGIALGVATMLSVVGMLGGAVKMFERILRSDAEMVVFEKNVSDLFFSNVPVTLVDELEKQPFVKEAQPVLFAIVTAPGKVRSQQVRRTPDPLDQTLRESPVAKFFLQHLRRFIPKFRPA